MITKVVAAFPGTGKSYFARAQKHAKRVVDLDSNAYTSGHTAGGKVLNPEFPSNYLAAIEEQLGRCDILLISIHAEVLAALVNEGVEITLVYPGRELKPEYIERFRRRNSPESFVDLFNKNWDVSLQQLESQKGCEHIVLQRNQYIGDVL